MLTVFNIMKNTNVKRVNHCVVDDVYVVLRNVHCYLSGSGPAHKARKHLTPRKRLALATGVE